MPTPRRLVASGVIDGKLYTAAGLVQGEACSGVLEVYDPASDTWSTKSPLPAQRAGAGGAVAGGKFYVMGGHDFYPQNAVLAYDPVTDTWATKSPMPVALGEVRAAVIDDKIYVSGGETPGVIIGSTEVYTPDTPEPDPCEAELAATQQQIQNLQDQLATADGTIQYLTQANQALTIQNGLLQSQLNALTGQNAQLQAANTQLATQLNAANQTIQDNFPVSKCSHNGLQRRRSSQRACGDHAFAPLAQAELVVGTAQHAQLAKREYVGRRVLFTHRVVVLPGRISTPLAYSAYFAV